jgi:hypothetical protein
LFNPIIPVDVPRDIWIVYVATAALFLVHLAATRTEASD